MHVTLAVLAAQTCCYTFDISPLSVKLIGRSLHPVIIGDRRGYRIKGMSSNDKARPVGSHRHAIAAINPAYILRKKGRVLPAGWGGGWVRYEERKL